MKVLPGKKVRPEMTVREFIEAFPALKLNVLAGKSGLARKIKEPGIQNPGLALAGVREFIGEGRIQVLGKAEIAYLKLHDSEIRDKILRPLYEKNVCSLLITDGLKPPIGLLNQANEMDTAVLGTPVEMQEAIGLITQGLTSALAPIMSVHGVLVDVYGVGLLIIGKGSIGKSESALDLIVRGHRLVSDDVVEIRRIGNALLGTAPELLHHHMELRGLGIVDIKELFGVCATRREKGIDLVVELEQWSGKSKYDRLGLDSRMISVLDVKIPYVLMPVAMGRNIAILLEVAVRNELLKRSGVNTPEKFLLRMKEAMDAGKDKKDEDV